MVVNSYNNEFGYELISCVPYAYWLHKRGLLKKTISGHDTESLYYFSPKHVINPEARTWYNYGLMDTPNRDIHKSELDLRQFEAPPYKEIYGGVYDYDIVICNRYNKEWPGVFELSKPINYFSLEWLEDFFYRNADKKIAYLNISGFKKHYDNSPPLPFADYELCQQHSNVNHILDIYESGSLNLLQMQIMAGSSEFHTLNGGYSILASYFGGVNYIYTKPVTIRGRTYPREVEKGDFNYYHNFGNSEIIPMRL
jgi:hypothetical protein